MKIPGKSGALFFPTRLLFKIAYLYSKVRVVQAFRSGKNQFVTGDIVLQWEKSFCGGGSHFVVVQSQFVAGDLILLREIPLLNQNISKYIEMK